jgi:hypothetical protein
MNTSVKTRIDWITFVVHTGQNPKEVIADFLGLPLEKLKFSSWGRYLYHNHYSLGHINVYFNIAEFPQLQGKIEYNPLDDPLVATIIGGDQPPLYPGADITAKLRKMGVCVELSSQALDELQGAFDVDLFALLARIHANPKVRLTRLDLAADDKNKILDMDTIQDFTNKQQYNSRTRYYKVFYTGEGLRTTGKTVYIGKKISDVFMRFYDKAKQTYNRKTQPDLYNSHWIRAEIVFKRERATAALDEILKAGTDAFGETVANLMNGFVTFTLPDATRAERRTVAPWWLAFVDTVTRLKIHIPKQAPSSVERSVNWLAYKLAPTLQVLIDTYGKEQIDKVIAVYGDRRSPLLEERCRDLKLFPPPSLPSILGTKFILGVSPPPKVNPWKGTLFRTVARPVTFSNPSPR